MHTLFVPDLSESDDDLVISGDEASHAAKVKRLGAGSVVRAMNGRGLIVIAEVIEARRVLRARVRERSLVEPARPAVHVWSATPKGPRIAEMVEGLTQVGAASWTPMQTKLGVVDPRESKLARMGRIVIEAAKQCGRAWLMGLGEKSGFTGGLEIRPAGDGRPALVLADAGGERYAPTGAGEVRVLIGPEGGFVADEVDAARRAGARVVNFGPHAMRIETAAVVAAAVVMHGEGGG